MARCTCWDTITREPQRPRRWKTSSGRSWRASALPTPMPPGRLWRRPAMADSSGTGRIARGNGHLGLWQRLRGLLKTRQGEAHLRETLEEIIDEIKDVEREEVSGVPISSDERVMLSNILRLRHLTAYDVMVPRADIVAVDLDTPL